jgi:hypothetical protein
MALSATLGQRHSLVGTADFYRHEEMLRDLVVPGSVQCLQELAQRYEIVYLGARPGFTLPYHRQRKIKENEVRLRGKVEVIESRRNG